MTVDLSPKQSARSFKARELARQRAYFGQLDQSVGDGFGPHRLPERALNFNPAIRDAAKAYFDGRIEWHREAAHVLSSQACCLNFLLPIAARADLVSRFLSNALGVADPEMTPVGRGPDGEPYYIAFEWIGGRSYLNEWPKNGLPKRGAHVTSFDVMMRFQTGGREEAVLVEWKYTEADAGPIQDKPPKIVREGKTYGNATRRVRYETLAFEPTGPVRSDLGLTLDDFFFHPHYQLLRQQMFARGMELDKDDPAERVRLLHIAPAGNTAVRRITGPALSQIAGRLGLTDAYALHGSLLTQPDDFVSRSTEALFGELIREPSEATDWAAYLTTRYAFLADVT